MTPVPPDLSIAASLQRTRDRINEAAAAAGRDPKGVRLLAVSKTQPIESIAEAVRAGQREFGESTIQEALTKIPRFPPAVIDWHFIGHLQTNKAKYLPGNFSWLHSLDDLRLADRINRVACDNGAVINTLVEVNVSRDPAKHGIDPEQLPAFLDSLLAANLAAVRLRGFMTIGPYTADVSERRRAFAALRELAEQSRARMALPDLTELSMGMSDDFREAILEGSTIVRVGSAIFGDRSYPNRR